MTMVDDEKGFDSTIRSDRCQLHDNGDGVVLRDEDDTDRKSDW